MRGQGILASFFLNRDEKLVVAVPIVSNVCCSSAGKSYRNGQR